MEEGEVEDSDQPQIQPILVGDLSGQKSDQPNDVANFSDKKSVHSTFPGNKSSQPKVQQNFARKNRPQTRNIQLKYSPNPNYRNWSYGVIAIFFPISLYLILGPFSQPNITGFSICCASPSFLCFLESIYLHGKSEWEIANEMPNGKTRKEMVFVIVLGIIWTGFFIFGFIELLNW